MKKSKEMVVAIRAAKEAGKILMKHYGKLKNIGFKEDESMVTKADLASEKKILSIIKKEFPAYSIYSEESGKELKGSEFLWLIDPLDGTTNYTIQDPFFNVAIGLAKKGKPILGVVYFPIHDELFYAESGKGAYLNGKRIHVSRITNLRKAVMGYCHSGKKSHVQRALKIYARLKTRATRHTRQFGSAALELAYVACGRLAAFEMSDMNAYDVAAGAVLVKEAGGKATDFKNKSFTLQSQDILASNGKVHSKLLKVIRGP